MIGGECVVWIAGSAVDYGASQYAFRHGAVEANPVHPRSPVASLAVQGSVAAVGCWGDARLRRAGRPKLARALRVGVFVLKLGLAVNAMRSVR